MANTIYGTSGLSQTLTGTDDVDVILAYSGDDYLLGKEKGDTLFGGSGDEQASIGEIIGPGFSSETVVDAIETLVDAYLNIRTGPDEDFLAAYRRVGQAPFKDALYGAA